MTRTVPRRRMTLQRSHIFFTDGRTFISLPYSLVPVHDPAARKVVRRMLAHERFHTAEIQQRLSWLQLGVPQCS